jgi:Asp-tRNA(Asn)/Glu-tRNA(Gln) amidotransferase A subunit family amidase
MHTRCPTIALVALCAACFFAGSILTRTIQAFEEHSPITRSMVEQAEHLLGLRFSNDKRDTMLADLEEARQAFVQMRTVELPNGVAPAFQFNPLPPVALVPAAFQPSVSKAVLQAASAVRVQLPAVRRPASRDSLAFFSITQLAALIKSRQLTSVELTTLYLERLQRYDSVLHCVVTLTPELALRQARRADDELKRGKYRGLLHGIPYGLKDLFATKGYPTTWGTAPYKNQVFDSDATVVRKLEEAGAVLVAKLTLGELAMGDTWFGGMTRNPWRLEQGSSGSSAGSAAATAAGLVAFAIGTETYGSIVSPSTRCGATGLRPTFGRVSRAGSMALSWTMDKVGPICRSAEDCAIVFGALHGADSLDPTTRNAPYTYSSAMSLKGVRIGYVQSLFENDKGNTSTDSAALKVIQALCAKQGATLVPIELPTTLPQYKGLSLSSLDFIIGAEASAAFDELTRSGRDSQMVRQTRAAWPNIFRAARFIPATEYIQANRIRARLQADMARLMDSVDCYIVPSLEGDNTLLTNLTGHPCVVVPNGFHASGRWSGTPVSICFVGRLFDEGRLLAVARHFQEATRFHRQYPVLQ